VPVRCKNYSFTKNYVGYPSIYGNATIMKWKWGIQLNTVMLVFQNGIKHTESPAYLAKGWD